MSRKLSLAHSKVGFAENQTLSENSYFVGQLKSHYSDSLDVARSATAILDTENCEVLIANESFKILLGREKEEWLGKPIFKMATNNTALHLKSDLEKFLENGAQPFGMYSFTGKYGEQKSAELHLRKILFLERPILHVHFEDVTEKRRMEAELHQLKEQVKHREDTDQNSKSREKEYLETERFHTAILNSVTIGCLLLDEEKKLRTFNQAASELMHHFSGLDLKLGDDFDRHIPENMLEEFHQYLKLAMRGDVFKTERPLPQNGDEDVWVKLTFAPAKGRGREILGVTLAIEDVTKAKRTEKLIIQRNKQLKKTNQELDKFVYSVSHDLRSPISNVLGLNYLVKTSETMEEMQQYAQMIDGAMGRMDDFIRNILDYSRNNRKAQKLESLALRKFVDELLSDHRLKGNTGGIEIRNEIDPALKWVTDQHRISIIVNNLVSNALKYGDTEKSQRWVEIYARSYEKSGEECLELGVKDNGLGIAEEHLSRIFQMFYTANLRAEGSGIGLYILSDAVKQLGGTVEVKSELGMGSEFTVDLPCKNPERK